MQINQVSGLILAGGQGRRMQLPLAAPEKPLLLLHDLPLIAWVHRALPAGLHQVFISANQKTESYAPYGRVIADNALLGLQSGPLVGLASVLSQVDTPWLFVLPGDVPVLPVDLFERLRQALIGSSQASIAYASTSHVQPLCMLLHKNSLKSLLVYLKQGGRSVRGWQKPAAIEVSFPPHCLEFFNINTQQDLAWAHAHIPRPVKN